MLRMMMSMSIPMLGALQTSMAAMQNLGTQLTQGQNDIRRAMLEGTQTQRHRDAMMDFNIQERGQLLQIELFTSRAEQAEAAIDDARATLERPNLPAHEKEYLTAKFQRAVVMESKARVQLEKAETDLQSIVDQRAAKVRQTLLQPTNEPSGLDTSRTSTIQASAGQITMLRAVSTGNGRSPPTLTELRTTDPALASTPAMPESPSPASPSPTGRRAPRTGLKRSSTDTQLGRVRTTLVIPFNTTAAKITNSTDSAMEVEE
ncbi:BQ5605_C003g02081 [Microbotryum silenes-dioicae]|uniref:BQ5605_C003g02081 protein n=1 Tax=Microbotryum silenes-dioicae TaxID=796604 RepID=A0A2X0P3E4_9BASI|nr:BQ5605_C003g02081 [Microbotryum silenes-dioicae]